MAEIEITYSASTLRGSFELKAVSEDAIWERVVQRAMAIENDYELALNKLNVPWVTALSLVREFAPLQRQQGFVLRPIGLAKEKINEFVRNYKAVREARGTLTAMLGGDEIDTRLRALSFTKRTLKPFQNRVSGTCSQSPTARISQYPGSGKTTVTLALDSLLGNRDNTCSLLLLKTHLWLGRTPSATALTSGVTQNRPRKVTSKPATLEVQDRSSDWGAGSLSWHGQCLERNEETTGNCAGAAGLVAAAD